MGNITVRFTSNSATIPTLGYEVGYKRLGVDPSPTFLATNPAPAADQSGVVSITVPDLLEGYNYEITVQPKCGITNFGTLLTFTKKLPKAFTLYRDPTTALGACQAAGTNTSQTTLYATALEIAYGVVLFKTSEMNTLTGLADNGWYSNGVKAFLISVGNGTVTSVQDCA